MKPIKPQFGISSDADFEKNTWTFEMPKKFEVRAGEFALIDKEDFFDLLNALKEGLADMKEWHDYLTLQIESFEDEERKMVIMNRDDVNERIEKAETAIKKATGNQPAYKEPIEGVWGAKK